MGLKGDAVAVVRGEEVQGTVLRTYAGLRGLQTLLQSEATAELHVLACRKSDMGKQPLRFYLVITASTRSGREGSECE